MFPTGRRLKTFREVAALASTDRALQHLLTEAIAHEQRTLALEDELDRLSQTTSELRALDTDIDQVDHAMDKSLTHLHDQLHALAAQGGAQGEAASALLDALFSTGAEAITSLPYIEQLGAVDALLEELQGPLADAVSRAKVQAEVKNIQALSVTYRQRLASLSPEELAAEQLCNARAQGQAFLRAALDAICALPDPARADLLAPALRQQAEIDASVARCGVVLDLRGADTPR
jgi:septal ring factor EnvC (AmiA/AmiB activator)